VFGRIGFERRDFEAVLEMTPATGKCRGIAEDATLILRAGEHPRRAAIPGVRRRIKRPRPLMQPADAFMRIAVLGAHHAWRGPQAEGAHQIRRHMGRRASLAWLAHKSLPLINSAQNATFMPAPDYATLRLSADAAPSVCRFAATSPIASSDSELESAAPAMFDAAALGHVRVAAFFSHSSIIFTWLTPSLDGRGLTRV
jgi:hypothetical protein